MSNVTPIINAQLDTDLIQIDDGDWEKIILYVDEIILTLEMSNALVKKGKLKNTVTHSLQPPPPAPPICRLEQEDT